jgi:hypothetical protein
MIVLAVVSGLFTFIYGICAFVHHVNAPGEQAYIIQLQKDLHVLDICDVETRDDLIRANTNVRKYKRYNAIGFFDWAIPDSWEGLEVVQLPNTACYKETDRKDYNLNISGIEAINIEATNEP